MIAGSPCQLFGIVSIDSSDGPPPQPVLIYSSDMGRWCINIKVCKRVRVHDYMVVKGLGCTTKKKD